MVQRSLHVTRNLIVFGLTLSKSIPQKLQRELMPIFKLIYYVDDIFYFRLFYTVYLMQLTINKITDDWIRIADLYQLWHNHCPSGYTIYLPYNMGHRSQLIETSVTCHQAGTEIDPSGTRYSLAYREPPEITGLIWIRLPAI